jgi:RNA polymerase sigma factor (sigma-70 family)
MSDIALPIAGVPQLSLPGRLLTDERLARLASAGSTRAFALLYERHHQALYRYCHSIVRNPHDAQDALQSALARAFAALPESAGDVAVRPWLFRIAHNEAVSILRQRRAHDDLVDEQESALTVERTIDQRERLSSLVTDLQALPERQRAALLMRELSGLSMEEIAAALSISPGAAKQTLFEARSSLHAFAEGRAMGCETVRRAISDGDGRVLHGRRIRAHLRACAGCTEFRALIDTRSADLRALAPPLPAVASAAMLTRLLGSTGGGHAGGAAAASGAGLGHHAAASLMLKGLAGVAVLAAAGAGTVQLASGPASHAHAPLASGSAHPVRDAAKGDALPPSRATFHLAGPPGAGLGVQRPLGQHPILPRDGQAEVLPAKAGGAPKAIPDAARMGAGRAGGHAHRGSSKRQPASRRSDRSHSPAKSVRPSSSPRSRGPHAGVKQRPTSATGGSGAGVPREYKGAPSQPSGSSEAARSPATTSVAAPAGPA